METSEGKVSIILPTHNGETYIRTAVDSCLSQTYREIELIIVDDGSTDGTSAIIESYDDVRIVYVRHDANMGLPAALNTGFSRSTGTYMTWTSDDNYYHLDAVKSMIEFMRASNSLFVYSDFYRICEDRHRTKGMLIRLPDTPVLKDENTIGACFLYSREVMETIGSYNEDAYLAEDYDYWIRVSGRFCMRHLSTPLYYYREHARALSARKVDVRIASLLVQIQNGLIDLDESCVRFSKEIAEPLWLEGHGTFDHGSLLRRVGLMVARRQRLKYAKMPRNTLSEFMSGRISFSDARRRVTELAGRCVADNH